MQELPVAYRWDKILCSILLPFRVFKKVGVYVKNLFCFVLWVTCIYIYIDVHFDIMLLCDELTAVWLSIYMYTYCSLVQMWIGETSLQLCHGWQLFLPASGLRNLFFLHHMFLVYRFLIGSIPNNETSLWMSWWRMRFNRGTDKFTNTGNYLFACVNWPICLSTAMCWNQH